MEPHTQNRYGQVDLSTCLIRSIGSPEWVVPWAFVTTVQLRSYATVVRAGSVRAAAVELGISEAAVSGNIGALRKELDDRLFHPSHAGLVFTPGGIRLAQRAVEILGLQELTRREVDAAHGGRRNLRIVASSLFAEYAAPGLIELFSTRADDLEVELIVESSARFDDLLLTHAADVAIGPHGSDAPTMSTHSVEFLRYGLVGVCVPALERADLTTFSGTLVLRRSSRPG